MIGIRFNPRQAKGVFLDNPAIKSMLKDRERRAFMRFGAYVRRDAKKSIRPARQMLLAEMSQRQRANYRERVKDARRKGRPRPKRPLKASRPGEPPRSRKGWLKQWILFVYEPLRRSVIIGPAKFARALGEAPKALEYGDRSLTFSGPRGKRRRRWVKIRKRPYMWPAYEKNEPKVPDLFRETS